MVGGTLEWWTSSAWHPEGSCLWVGGTRSGTYLLKCWRMNWMTCLGFLSFGPHSWGSSPTAGGWNLHLLSQDCALLLLTASPPASSHRKLKHKYVERALPPVSSWAWLVLNTWHGPLPFCHTILISRWCRRRGTWLLEVSQGLCHLPEIFDTIILGALFKFSVSHILLCKMGQEYSHSLKHWLSHLFRAGTLKQMWIKKNSREYIIFKICFEG